jgi:hypothetical protein
MSDATSAIIRELFSTPSVKTTSALTSNGVVAAVRMPRPSKMPSPIDVSPFGSRSVPLIKSFVVLRLMSDRPPLPSGTMD